MHEESEEYVRRQLDQMRFLNQRCADGLTTLDRFVTDSKALLRLLPQNLQEWKNRYFYQLGPLVVMVGVIFYEHRTQANEAEMEKLRDALIGMDALLRDVPGFPARQ